MACQPAVVLGLVGAEVGEHDVDLELRVRMGGQDFVHEVEALAPPTPGVGAGLDLPCRHFEGRDQRRRPMALAARQELPWA